MNGFAFTCITVRRSALPVRTSYNVQVRSDPTLASTLDSLGLNLTEVIVSVDAGKDKFAIGAVLVSSHTWTVEEAVENSGSER